MKGIRAMAATALMVAFSASASFAADPSGSWKTESGDTVVKITKSGSSYVGVITWAKAGSDCKPDPVGFQLLSVKEKGGKYKGSVTNYKNCKTYRGDLTVNGNKMKLTGRVGPFSRTTTWTKTN